MKETVLQRLCCAGCRSSLAWEAFSWRTEGELGDGVAWCKSCGAWYPVEDGLLELLPPELAYRDDRRRFWEKHRSKLKSLQHTEDREAHDGQQSSAEAQLKQQQHFDWYASNDQQTYQAYEGLPLWRAVDEKIFAAWRRQIIPNGWLLDVGCAQGRATFRFTDLPLHIVGFDISKALVRQAIQRSRMEPSKADVTFFVGDGSKLPVQDETFDHVLVYGVLHHLPDPEQTCREIAKILKKGGIYFGLENNRSIFRALFDLLMKINPIWHEEAGAQPLIGADQFEQWFAGSHVHIECGTRVFLPPHLVNRMGQNWGRRLLQFTDCVARGIPWFRDQGGLIEVCGKRDALPIAS